MIFEQHSACMAADIKFLPTHSEGDLTRLRMAVAVGIGRLVSVQPHKVRCATGRIPLMQGEVRQRRGAPILCSNVVLLGIVPQPGWLILDLVCVLTLQR